MILKERATGVHVNVSQKEITDIIYLYKLGYNVDNIVNELNIFQIQEYRIIIVVDQIKITGCNIVDIH